MRDTVKSYNICIIGAPELKNRENVEKALFREITAKKFQKLCKNSKTDIQEVRKTPRIQTKKTTAKHITI